jgi:hypothetical protein
MNFCSHNLSRAVHKNLPRSCDEKFSACFSSLVSRGSSVGIAAAYALGDRGVGVQVLVG